MIFENIQTPSIFIVRPKKNNVVFPITGPKINGSVGRKIFFFLQFFLSINLSRFCF